jgi:hypothetical protein
LSGSPKPARESVIHLLTEAAEIEHNLLCSYLYAAFSLKDGSDGGFQPGEADAVNAWRRSILGVAVEEMSHLALVNNLLVALGGAAHFDRPNLPVAPGYHPAGFVIRLVPLTKATLDHFIYLERPADAPVREGAGGYRERAPVRRETIPGSLTPSTPDYETIGEFYAGIRSDLIAFANAHGNAAFLPSSRARQLTPEVLDVPGLMEIATLEDAIAALDMIVEQGEGSSCAKQKCHFSRFSAMRRQWDELEASNPAFRPYREAAHDPVMRRPEEGLKRVWITHSRAARLLDLGNAVYGLALALLRHCYAAQVPASLRAQLAVASVKLMRALGILGPVLTLLPAQQKSDARAGLTFAVPRNLHDVGAADLAPLLRARLSALRSSAKDLGQTDVAAILEEIEAG